MTDPDLILKKLAFIESCIRELREIARPELIGRDLREERFIAHTLQIAIQAALDVASHIVSDRRLGEPATNRQLFDLLARDGWVTDELTAVLGNMAGFRNILVHGYQDIDNAILRDVVERHLGDLHAFAEAVRARMGGRAASQ